MAFKLSKLLMPFSDKEQLLKQIRESPAALIYKDVLKQAAPDLKTIPQTTYSLYREFENNGYRDNYQRVYFAKRTMLTRAVVEFILGDHSYRDALHDLLWSICEETTWVLPAHEEQGPDYWDLKPSPRQKAWSGHTLLTRPPDSIDLFAAETGAALAETIHLLSDQLSPEVCLRVRHEVDRHIFQPYLAYGRKHWWFKGELNWNGVCNGSIGLAFMRLQQDPDTLVEALEAVLEGFEAYIERGFEADGGSVEGVNYWNYGLLYYVTLAELLREQTQGKIDLLANDCMKAIARYPLGMALSPGLFVNFGDATEDLAVSPGIVNRLAERTGVHELCGLIQPPDRLEGKGVTTAKLAIVLRDIVWWDGKIEPFPPAARKDFYFPTCDFAKLTAKTKFGEPVVLATKAGHNDGHHSHTDIASFIYHLNGETLLCDPGRGLYSREYFRQDRYKNIFCNSFGHSVPLIGGKMQSPGFEFGGSRQYSGKIIDHELQADNKTVLIEFHTAYNLAELTLARRLLRIGQDTGEVFLEDHFSFTGSSLEIEEAFLTWMPVEVKKNIACVIGSHNRLELVIEEPNGVSFQVDKLEKESRENQRPGILTRISIQLPAGCTHFCLKMIPYQNQ